jgi:hypothetical protein
MATRATIFIRLHLDDCIGLVGRLTERLCYVTERRHPGVCAFDDTARKTKHLAARCDYAKIVIWNNALTAHDLAQ